MVKATSRFITPVEGHYQILDALLTPVLSGAQPLAPVYEAAAADVPQPPARLAEGYTVEVDLATVVDGQSVA